MNQAGAIKTTGRTAFGSGRVHQVTLPAKARELTTLSRVDYEDAFLADTGRHRERMPEQWARATLEDAPLVWRSALPLGWLALGLQLGPDRPEQSVLGWEVRRSTSEYALLGRKSRLGMPAELLFKRHGDALLFSTLVQHENAIARAAWARIAPPHRRVVRYLLGHAADPSRGIDGKPPL